MSNTTLDASIARAKNDIRQSENLIKQLAGKQSVEERKARTRRLIERGALLESVIDDAAALSNEQLKRLLHAAFDTQVVRDLTASLRVENAQKAADADA